jgi:hypothetical protein
MPDETIHDALSASEKLPPKRATEIIDAIMDELSSRGLTVTEVLLFFVWLQETAILHAIKNVVGTLDDNATAAPALAMKLVQSVEYAQQVSRESVLERFLADCEQAGIHAGKPN